MICCLCPARRWCGKVGIRRSQGFFFDLSGVDRVTASYTHTRKHVYALVLIWKRSLMCRSRTQNQKQRRTNIRTLSSAGIVSLSLSIFGLMYWSQGSIAALPAAINSLGLLDAQTVYWSVLTMTKSHPSQRAKEPRRREREQNNTYSTPLLSQRWVQLWEKGPVKKREQPCLDRNYSF